MYSLVSARQWNWLSVGCSSGLNPTARQRSSPRIPDERLAHGPKTRRRGVVEVRFTGADLIRLDPGRYGSIALGALVAPRLCRCATVSACCLPNGGRLMTSPLGR